MKLRVITERYVNGIVYKPRSHNPDGTWNSGIYEDLPDGHAEALLSAGAAEQIDKPAPVKDDQPKKSRRFKPANDDE